MDESLKSKCCMVWDYGVWPELAVRLTREFGRVMYFSEWRQAFPKRNDFQVGVGVEGLERVENPWDHLDEVDLWIFPWLYNASEQRFLRSIGKLVWGNGGAEEAELDRWAFWQYRRQVGLPVTPTVRIVGLTALREHLQSVENKFVKTSRFRGDDDTWEHTTYEASESHLDELKHDLGPIAETQEFLVEDPIKSEVEVGGDYYSINGQYPPIVSYGYEIKDACHIEKIVPYEELPAHLKNIDSRMSMIFESNKARGFYATEARITEQGVAYFTDVTMRFPYPPGEGLIEAYDNWGEIMYYGAQGIVIPPRPLTTYFAIARIICPDSEKNWSTIVFPPELRQWIKFHDLTSVNGRAYVIPYRMIGWKAVGSLVGFGESVDDAIGVVRERAEYLKGYQLSTTEDQLDKAKDAISQGEELDISF
jgi:hypothetical protein